MPRYLKLISVDSTLIMTLDIIITISNLAVSDVDFVIETYRYIIAGRITGPCSKYLSMKGFITSINKFLVGIRKSRLTALVKPHTYFKRRIRDIHLSILDRNMTGF